MTWYMATRVPNKAPTIVHMRLSVSIRSSSQTPSQVHKPMAAAMENAMPEKRMKEGERREGFLLGSSGLRMSAKLGTDRFRQ